MNDSSYLEMSADCDRFSFVTHDTLFRKCSICCVWLAIGNCMNRFIYFAVENNSERLI